MKEQIYTIPVNEIYDTVCSCPLCELEKRIENESVDYSLGAAMMEPDFRVESNDKGYCIRHYEMMFKRPNKLSLALVLDTHTNEISEKMKKYEKSISALKNRKKGLFKKSGAKDTAHLLYEFSKSLLCSCMICQKIDFTMERYEDVIMYMWANNEEFRKKFEKSDGFCLKHFSQMCNVMPSSLSDSECADFLPLLFDMELRRFAALGEDIHKFTLKFDYRNKDMPWGTAQDAPKRVIETLGGKMTEL